MESLNDLVQVQTPMRRGSGESDARRFTFGAVANLVPTSEANGISPTGSDQARGRYPSLARTSSGVIKAVWLTTSTGNEPVIETQTSTADPVALEGIDQGEVHG